MPDGKRKRRHSQNKAKRDWYATSRAFRFARRFGDHPCKCLAKNPLVRSHMASLNT
jgi:hypothetical protein